MLTGAKQELQRATAPLSVTLPPRVPETATGLTPTVMRMSFGGVATDAEGSGDVTRPKAQRVETIARETTGDKAVSMRKSGSSSNLEEGGRTPKAVAMRKSGSSSNLEEGGRTPK